MQAVTSQDGTSIAFGRLGDGPPVILVCGGSTDRSPRAWAASRRSPPGLTRRPTRACSWLTIRAAPLRMLSRRRRRLESIVQAL